MKKLLSLLSSLTLTATTAASVVSCGSDKSDEPSVNPNDENNQQEILQLIEEYKSQVNQMITSHIEANKDKLFEVADLDSPENQATYNFINASNIEKYGKNTDDSGASSETITATDFTKLFTDFSNILDLKKLETDLNNLAKNTSKYDLIIDKEVVDTLAGNQNSLKIQYTKNAGGTGAEDQKYFVSSIELEINVTVKYKDYEGQIQKVKSSDTLVFTYTDNQTLVTSIQNMQSNIKDDYLSAIDGNYAWLDKSALKVGTAAGFENTGDLLKISNDDSRKAAFTSIYESTEFKTEIQNFIKQKYFGALNGIPLNITGDVKLDSTSKTKSLELTSTKGYLDSKDTDTFDGMRTAVLQKLEETDADISLKDYSDRSVNKSVYDYLAQNIKTMVDAYQTEFKKVTDGKEGLTNRNISQSFMHGQNKISGLFLKINDNYNLAFNSLTLQYSVSADNTDKAVVSGEDSLKNTSLGNAIYVNTVKGIKSFQNVFDTQAPTHENANGQTVAFAFKGKPVDKPELTSNIWTNIKNSNGSYAANLNASLSLTTSEQSTFRNLLLEGGSQTLFDLRLVNVSPEGVAGTGSGIYADYTNSETGLYQSSRYQGYGTRFTGVRFQLNFISISLGFSQWSYGNGLKETNGQLFVQKIV